MTLQHDLLNCSYFEKQHLCAAGPWTVRVGAAPISSCALVALSSALAPCSGQSLAQGLRTQMLHVCRGSRGELPSLSPGLQAAAAFHKTLDFLAGDP